MSDEEAPEQWADDEASEDEVAESVDVLGVARQLLEHPEVKEAALDFARDLRARAEGSPIGRVLLQFGRDWMAGRAAREAQERSEDR